MSSKNDIITSLSYYGLSDEEKKKIEKLGRQAYKNLISSLSADSLNNFFKENNINLEYGTPTKEYLEKNIVDAEWALKNLPLDESARNKLSHSLFLLQEQLRSDNEGKKGKYVIYFQEKNGDIKEWSIVNLFDNNVTFWLSHINRFLNKREIKRYQIGMLIDRYFSEPFKETTEDGSSILHKHKLAEDDLLISIGSVDSYRHIVDKTWNSGSAVESEFVNFLKKNKFNDSSIRVFSGKKNVVDGIGIDLAIYANGKWNPIQVKSNKITNYYVIPKDGFGVYKENNTFVIINKEGAQVSLSEINGYKQRTSTPTSVDYLGSMGITKP
jgi:hypothetical protein